MRPLSQRLGWGLTGAPPSGLSGEVASLDSCILELGYAQSAHGLGLLEELRGQSQATQS